jgi:hypothetical protein
VRFRPRATRTALAAIASLALLAAGSASAEDAPSNTFTHGEIRLTPGTGGGFVPIDVPGPGTLVMVDAGPKVSAPGKSARQWRIRRIERSAAGAPQLLLPLSPTKTGAELLTAKGELRFRVQVTFIPAGGTAASQTFGVELKLSGAGG